MVLPSRYKFHRIPPSNYIVNSITHFLYTYHYYKKLNNMANAVELAEKKVLESRLQSLDIPEAFIAPLCSISGTEQTPQGVKQHISGCFPKTLEPFIRDHYIQKTGPQFFKESDEKKRKELWAKANQLASTPAPLDPNGKMVFGSAAR